LLVVVGLLSLAILTGQVVVIEFRIDQNGLAITWPPSISEQARDPIGSMRQPRE
jgi:hypothetical protein